jgi:hypothetical protein
VCVCVCVCGVKEGGESETDTQKETEREFVCREEHRFSKIPWVLHCHCIPACHMLHTESKAATDNLNAILSVRFGRAVCIYPGPAGESFPGLTHIQSCHLF